MNKKVIKTDLICPECGNIYPIMRKTSKQKKLFHRKWLFCPFCNMKTNHIEVKDIDLLIEELVRKENLSEEEKKVYKLIKRSE